MPPSVTVCVLTSALIKMSPVHFFARGNCSTLRYVPAERLVPACGELVEAVAMAAGMASEMPCISFLGPNWSYAYASPSAYSGGYCSAKVVVAYCCVCAPVPGDSSTGACACGRLKSLDRGSRYATAAPAASRSATMIMTAQVLLVIRYVCAAY